MKFEKHIKKLQVNSSLKKQCSEQVVNDMHEKTVAFRCPKLIQVCLFSKGSVYFTGDILVATDRLELLCHQSKIRSRGMTQYQEKGHLVRKTPSCSWCNG